MILCTVSIILYSGVKLVIENIRTIGQIILGSALFVYLIDIFRQRWHQKRLIIKLKKEVAFELFSEEIVLASIISDLNSLLKDPLGRSSAHWFSLNITSSILSSGQFVNFEHKFNDFLFRMYSQFKKIHFELDSFMKQPQANKEHKKFLEDGKRHSVEAFEQLQKSKIYRELKNRYFKEWAVEIRIEDMELPEGIEIPKDDEILDMWEDILREKAGLLKRNESGKG